MTIEHRIGDVFERLAEIPDGSIDLIVSSPPFLALRSYLPADHPDKHKEIGSEPTPAAFIDTQMALAAEYRRVLAPHGSLCYEIGDTYAGGGQSGWHRDGYERSERSSSNAESMRTNSRDLSTGWPLAKSMCLIPHAFTMSLAYGRNIITGNDSPAGTWRVRNVICWARPNPPVGALGDKFRPATSYITVACAGPRRYFDLDAVRTDHARDYTDEKPGGQTEWNRSGLVEWNRQTVANPAGAPPLDWHTDNHPEDGDWLWKMSTQPFKGTAGTVRWELLEADDGADDTRRTVSPDCPLHAGQPDQAPTAPDGEHEADHQTRIVYSDGDLDLELPSDYAPSDENRDRSGSSHDQTSESQDRECSPAATARSTASSRTGHAPATNQPDTPSAETADSTAHTSTSPESSERDPDTDESSTSSDDSASNPSPETSPDTVDTEPSSQPCTCTFHRRIVDYTSHYAAFPLTLPKRLIEAMCPQRVCRTCGKPSERVTGDVEYVNSRTGKPVTTLHYQSGTMIDGHGKSINSDGQGDRAATRQAPTLGWTDCGHNDWRTGVTLDPFGGSGTTGAAALAVGRDCILIDLDERNADLARERIGMFLDIIEGAAS